MAPPFISAYYADNVAEGVVRLFAVPVQKDVSGGIIRRDLPKGFSLGRSRAKFVDECLRLVTGVVLRAEKATLVKSSFHGGHVSQAAQTENRTTGTFVYDVAGCSGLGNNILPQRHRDPMGQVTCYAAAFTRKASTRAIRSEKKMNRLDRAPQRETRKSRAEPGP